jgi:hypothetical protein
VISILALPCSCHRSSCSSASLRACLSLKFCFNLAVHSWDARQYANIYTGFFIVRYFCDEEF